MNEIIKKFLDEGYLLEPNFFNKISKDVNIEEFVLRLKNKIKEGGPLVLNEELFLIIENGKKFVDVNWFEFEKSKTFFDKGIDEKAYQDFLNLLNLKEETIIKRGSSSSVLVNNYKEEFKKRDIQDFVIYFRNRYEFLKNILKYRQELKDVCSISRVLNRERENVSIIGIVKDKRITKNNNIILNLEDLSGSINILINSNRKEVYDLAKDIVLDEVIGICGLVSKDIIFVNKILLPDIPVNNELKKSLDEVYVVFSGDLQVGSKTFFEEKFLKFVDWLNGSYGDYEQKEIAKKVKYLFLVGDIVEGVGIYPGQDKDLKILDIYEQYDKSAELISKIRKDIEIIICPGNHDALRLSEPQPVLDKNLAKSLYELPNVHFATNPSYINIHSSEDFLGFDVLLYHGGSFAYLAENVDSVRISGRLERPDLIMKFLLQRRHLAPSHGSTLYIPDIRKDPLLIDKIPDFFVSGHVHKVISMDYRGVTLINAGCWTGQTENQEKRGIVPDPGKVLLVNLKNRKTITLDFN